MAESIAQPSQQTSIREDGDRIVVPGVYRNSGIYGLYSSLKHGETKLDWYNTPIWLLTAIKYMSNVEYVFNYIQNPKADFSKLSVDQMALVAMFR